MKWEVVMGLEVHAELLTKTKLFCACTTAFGGEPNTHVCPGCAGMPGTLPVLNRAVVESAVRLGLALNCTIAEECGFDRKNYFYPDLPKAYQVSQLYEPICTDGFMEVEADGEIKRIRIKQIHIEEDAGKLVHDPRSGKTFMDFNRSSVPLLEIVSQPDFRKASEVLAYLEKLREILIYLGICDGKMQEGSLRADVNLSVRPAGDGELGVRTETKNLNSFKAIGRAIEAETARHIDILESGGTVVQETRRWDDDAGESYGMRSKENAQDYRYFPDPDLPSVRIGKDWLESIRETLPELAHQKRERYVKDFGLKTKEAAVLTAHKNISALFEDIARRSGQAAESAHLVSGEILRLMNAAGTLPEELKADGRKLSELVTLVLNGKINRSAYKKTIEAVWLHDVEPGPYIAEHGLMMIGDEDAVSAAAAAVVSGNPDAVAEFKAGKEKAFGFLIGQVMRSLGRAGDPDMVRRILTDALEK
jgi:aspartyl-tRNA(Asn)/glutamyl-tRNA(Gln) amidotransferase subunit B